MWHEYVEGNNSSKSNGGMHGVKSDPSEMRTIQFIEKSKPITAVHL